MELQNDIQNTWNAFYQALGIKNLPMKMERQTASEINDYGEPTDLRALSELKERRAAYDVLNDRFAKTTTRQAYRGGVEPGQYQ